MGSLDALRSLLTPEEWKYCQERLAVFDDPKANRKQLADAANDPKIFALEKKYVPRLNAERSKEIKCDTLISTVGLRLPPVLLTVLCLQPKKVFLLHTAASRPVAEQIRDDPDIQALGLKPNEDVILQEISETDAPYNYEILQQKIISEAEGQIIVDPTGGVKIMGVSLAAFAFWRRIPMVYLQGEEVKGIVRPFSERLTRVENPYDHFGDPDIALLKELFDRGNYLAAYEVCHRLRETVHNPATLGMLVVLEELIAIYRDWDGFLHSHGEKQSPQRKLGTRLEALKAKLKRLGLRLVEEKQLDANICFLKALEKTWRPVRNNAEPYRLVDIFVNAERRAGLGQYDDAVARLYRCLEMCATIRLVEQWEIGSPHKPVYKRIAEAVGGQDRLEEKYQELRQREPPAPGVPLGLDDQMAFLEIAEPSSQIVAIYNSMRAGQRSGDSLMDKRNRSILAHGTIPITEQEYREFEGKVRAIIQATIGTKRFRELQQQARHPKLLIGG